MNFDDFDNAMEANEIHNSDRDEFDDENVVYDEDGEWEIEDDYEDGMDGDFDSGMASAGYGTDEDYGYYGDSDLGGEY